MTWRQGARVAPVSISTNYFKLSIQKSRRYNCPILHSQLYINDKLCKLYNKYIRFNTNTIIVVISYPPTCL